MNFDDWRPALRNAREYLRDLDRFIEELLPGLIEQGLDPEAESAYESIAGRFAEVIAGRMLERVSVTNARSWREAARRSMHARQIYAALRNEMQTSVGVRVRELIAENARLIGRLPEVLARQTTAYVQREQQKGRRSTEIAADLERRLPGIAHNRAKLIARTEVAKADTALSQARSENLGIQWYEWATSEDQRVRPSHRVFDKVLVNWSDPPSPEMMAGEKSVGKYHAGCVFNCRCIALPLIDLNEVTWPHKVYHRGTIEYVGRAAFERWIRVPAAA